MSIGRALDQLGATLNIQAAQAAPSTATDGYYTKGHRFCNVNVAVTVGTSVDVQIYLYNGQGWVLYTDVPTTTVTAANGGGLLQLEIRGQPRIAVRVTNLVGVGATANVFVTGVTY